MNRIQLWNAKATLSAVVDQAPGGELSAITRHGRPEAMPISFAGWQRLSRVPPFGRLLIGADWRFRQSPPPPWRMAARS